MGWLVSGMRVAAVTGPCRGHTAREGVRTLRGDPVGASRLERRCCGAVFSPKHACTALLAGGGNHASLWDAMRGRSLFYFHNLLKTIYLNQKTGVPSGIATEQVGDAPLRSGSRTRPGRRHSRQAGPVALDLAHAQCRTRLAVPCGGTRPRHGPQRPGARLSDPTTQFLLWDIPWNTSGLV